MQTLWTRVAQQSCTCRCPSCVFTQGALAKRQVATARQLLLRPLQSATFGYSAIFAGACLIDGKLKKDRTAELDKSLASAKREYGTVALAVEEKVANETAFPVPGTSISQHLGNAIFANQDSGVQSSVEEHFTWEQLRRYEIEGKGRPAVNVSDGTVPSSKLPPQSLWAASHTKTRTGASKFSDRKLRMHELAIARLVVEIFIDAELFSDGSTEIPLPYRRLDTLRRLSRSELIELRNKLASMINKLKSVPESLFESSYKQHKRLLGRQRWMPRYQEGASPGRSLNRYLYQEFSDALYTTDQSYKQAALRICAGLVGNDDVVVPPNYATWNTLLMGYTKLERHDIVGRVYVAFNIAKARPNELTCALVLNHFSTVGDAQGFTRFVDRMRGLSTGLMLAKPDLVNTSDNAPRITIKSGAHKRKVIQKVAPNPMVYNTLVGGMLKFFGPDFAVNFCQEMNAEGWTADRQVLGQLLRSYASENNWDGCASVWKHISELVTVRKVSGSQSQFSPMDYRLGATMLRVCLKASRQEDFNRIFNSAVNNGFDGQRLMRTVDDVDDGFGLPSGQLPSFKGFRKVLAQARERRGAKDLPDMPVLGALSEEEYDELPIAREEDRPQLKVDLTSRTPLPASDEDNKVDAGHLLMHTTDGSDGPSRLPRIKPLRSSPPRTAQKPAESKTWTPSWPALHGSARAKLTANISRDLDDCLSNDTAMYERIPAFA